MKKLIVIADWANDSLTCQELRSTVAGYLKDPDKANISFVASIPSTIHTAFLTHLPHKQNRNCYQEALDLHLGHFLVLLGVGILFVAQHNISWESMPSTVFPLSWL